MTGKEAKTHIIDTINGDMVKEYFINEILPEILKDLERLEKYDKVLNERCGKCKSKENNICVGMNEPIGIETLIDCLEYNILCSKQEIEELKNDRILDRVEKEELERVNKVLHHNLEEKVEIIADLEKENQKLKKENKILSHNSTNIVMTDTEIMKRNIELQTEIQELKAKAKKYDEIVNLRTTPNALESSLAKYMNKCMAFEKENEKLKAMCQAIPPLAIKNEKLKKIIKDYCYIDNFPEGEVIRMCCESYEESNREDFEFLKEVFGE